MKLTITEQQVERFAERMGYIDKIIKNQMREGEWTYLEHLVERYGLIQQDVDIIGMIERNILDSMVGRTIDITDPQFSHILHSDDDFTFTIDEVIPKTQNPSSHQTPLTMFKDLDMNLPRFVLKGSLVSYNKELENNQTWLDHVLDLMIEVVTESNPILKALGVNVDFADYPVDYEGKDTVTPYNNLNESTIKSKRDKIDNLLKRLKKLYPKLDYCIGNDDTLQVYTNYEETDPVTFTETGLIFDPIEPPSDFWRIGNFTDYREIENGEYVDRVVDMVERSPEERVIEWLDHEFGLADGGSIIVTPHYYGEPYGDEPMFDWKKCED